MTERIVYRAFCNRSENAHAVVKVRAGSDGYEIRQADAVRDVRDGKAVFVAVWSAWRPLDNDAAGRVACPCGKEFLQTSTEIRYDIRSGLKAKVLSPTGYDHDAAWRTIAETWDT